MSDTTTIHWEQDQDGVVTLVLDDPTQSVNTMNEAFTADFEAVVERLAGLGDSLRGVVITSGKKTFFAGGDLRMLSAARPEDAEVVFEKSMRIKRSLRKLETLGKPVVAAVNGSALGGGLEIALACHHRIALNTPASRIGLPEVTLGLLPGGGGVVRTVRLFGITDALLKFLLEGRQYRPAQALEHGLVHELVDTPEELTARAKAWI
ncbi:enoyl-CoA hydratase/isomerase family protein, partial [Streptomyces sp. FH025]|uniref:enoyl-CoA hydratase/isomerase family protein n=1 Tax=Streptomyces sp. FH025 TaxID=2815937 RepID=UPI001A9F1A97